MISKPENPKTHAKNMCCETGLRMAFLHWENCVITYNAMYYKSVKSANMCPQINYTVNIANGLCISPLEEK